MTQERHLPRPTRDMFPSGPEGDALYMYMLNLVSQLGTPVTGTGSDEVPTNSDLSDGTTGGSGSAGADNQHIQVTLNGVTYKLLHDGTV